MTEYQKPFPPKPTFSPGPIVAFIHCADEAARETSFQRQKQDIDSYAAKSNACISEYYYDHGSAVAAATQRPELDKLMADARAGKFSVIVCIGIDRLSRDMSPLQDLFQELTVLGIQLHDVRLGRISLAQVVLMNYMTEASRKD